MLHNSSLAKALKLTLHVLKIIFPFEILNGASYDEYLQFPIKRNKWTYLLILKEIMVGT